MKEQLKSFPRQFFFDYYDKSNDSKRLSVILLIFAFVLCPPFAFMFRWAGAPDFLFFSMLITTVVFPLLLFLERVVGFFKNRLPVLYLIYFMVLIQYTVNQMYHNNFQQKDMLFFIGLFCTFNFGLQRFYLSMIFWLSTLITFVSYNQIYVSERSINQLPDDLSFLPYNVLLTCIGLFYLVVYYGRNRMINDVEDHNRYLRRIVNNLGHGVLLFQLRGSNISLVDFNQQLIQMTDEDVVESNELWLSKLISPQDLSEIKALAEEQVWEREVHHDDGQVYSVTVTRITLKKGVYYIASLQDITSKIIENNRIRENERKYKNLFIRNLTGVLTLDQEGNILECNPAFLRLFHQTDFKLIRLFPDLEVWQKLREELFRQETITNYQVVIRDDLDQEYYYVFNFYYDYERDLIEGNVVDVTEITLSSKALKENEKKFRALYEESYDSILLLDFDRIMDINQQGLQLLGKQVAEVSERSLWDFSYNQSPELKKQYDSHFAELKQKKTVRFNWIFAHGNTYIETLVSIIELRIGDEVLNQCVIHNETERNQSIRTLEQSKKTFESIIENTPEGFLILKEKNPVFASKEFYRILNIDPVPIEQLQLNETYFGAGVDNLKKLIAQQAEKRKALQHQLKWKIGEQALELDVSIVSIVFDNADATLLIFKDISLQNQLSREILRTEILADANKQLEEEIIERKQVEQRLESEYLRTKSLFDSSQSTLLLTLNPALEISDFNRPSKEYFEEQTQRELEQGISFEAYFDQIISPIKLRYFKYQLSSVRKGKTHQFELKFINRKNQKRWVVAYLSPIMDVNGVLTEFSLIGHDITDKKNSEKEILLSLKEKEVLLKEVHHRVKNNLQIISSILNLQSSYIEDPNILEIIEESRHRIRSMAIIHENLYQNTNFSSINFKNYSRELVRNLISSYSFSKELEVELVESVDLVELNLDQAIPCGLLINELITNSMKYAFAERKKGKIFLELKNKNNNITLVVGDDGVGLPESFDLNLAETLGLQLVVTLVEQLDGDIQLDRSSGIKYFITFERQKL